MLNNIYNVSNPSEILNILWDRIKSYSDDFSKLLLFLPSRRAIRSFEMLIVKNVGHAVVLPNMVPLGTGVDNEEETDVLSNQERVIKLASILTSVPYIKTISAALPLAHDFVAMQDYLENEGIDIKTIDWDEVFNMNDSTDTATQNTKKAKAELLKIMTNFLDGISVKSVDEYTSIQDYVEKTNEDTSDINWNDVFNSAKSELLKGMTKQNMLKTQTQTRNENILLWKEKIKNYEKVIVCGSTASVPVTADLMEYIAHCDNGEIILSGKISGQKSDLERDTNPYYAEYKFLKKLGMEPTDVITLGKENKYIDFYNEAFGNTCEQTQPKPDNFTYVECNRENQEAALALQLAIDTIKSDKNKTVLIVTPDKVANQRIRTEVENYNSQQNDKDKIAVDFSAGISGNMTGLGRALLNLIDDFINDKNEPFDKLFQMSNGSLKSKTQKGLIWSAIDNFGNQGIQFLITIIIARLLTPEIYGIIAMPTFFLALAQCFIKSGFGNALIRKNNLEEIDLSTAFIFNIVVGCFMYFLLFCTSPLIADFYSTPILKPMLRVTALALLFNPLCIVQQSLLTRSIDFKRQAKITICSSFSPILNHQSKKKFH